MLVVDKIVLCVSEIMRQYFFGIIHLIDFKEYIGTLTVLVINIQLLGIMC